MMEISNYKIDVITAGVVVTIGGLVLITYLRLVTIGGTVYIAD